MTDIDFHFIGWCIETEPNGTKHDKVWTAFSIGDRHFAAWGKRDKSLSFKEYGAGYAARREQEKVMRQKKAKYTEVDAFNMFAVFPNFAEDVEKKFMFATLSGKIR